MRHHGNVTRWLDIWSSFGERAGGSRSVRRNAGSRSSIQGSAPDCENEWMPDKLMGMLYSVNAALSVNSRWWQGEIERDNVTVCSGDDGRVVDEKERWGMKMRTIWMIRTNIINHGYDLPEWDWKTSYWCYYAPDRDLYLHYWGW